ncbi:MAG: TetR/AcrR family transcriptional regulator [Burkholderiaceae bacterium]|nr:TetR/AcrR family transcriptional regulator [Burkholderiaceae bacterium]
MSATAKPKSKSPAKTPRKPRAAVGRASRADDRIGTGHSVGMREEVNAYKKELLLRAACETFYEHGYHDTTVDMLAEKLSGTKAIFYYYYTDKRAVLEEIYRRSLSAAQAVVQRAIDQGGTPAVMLKNFAYHYTLWVIDNQRLVDVFWREERTISTEVRSAIAIEQKKFDDMVSRIIREGVASGHFTSDDAQTTARAIAGMISFIYTWWRPDRRLSREDAATSYAELALRLAGVATSGD